MVTKTTVCGTTAIALAIACGGGVSPNPHEDLTTEWRILNREYPYSGARGETVCAEYGRVAEHGLVEVDREIYFFDKINDKLSDRIDLDAGASAKILGSGSRHVTTCKQARDFMQKKHDYFESRPSLEPETTSPDAEAVPEEVVPEGASVDRIDKVRDSNTFDDWPTVHLRIWQSATTFTRCSGVLINQYAIITAAHCIGGVGGMYRVSVDYGGEFDDDPAMGDWCISNNSPDCELMPSAENFAIHAHPDWTGVSDTDDDIAVAVHWTWDPWEVIGDDARYYMVLTKTAPVAGTSFWVRGYGHNRVDGGGSGIGRRSLRSQGISWTDAEYWLSYVTEGVGHPCKGDSGSAAVNTTKVNGLVKKDLSMGVCSNFQVADITDHCPSLGKKFRYTKVNPKVGWINEVLGALSAGTCTSAQSDSSDWQYWKCYPQ